MTTRGPAYIPAARWSVFSRIYDPVLALTMRERRFRAAMRERVSAALPEAMREIGRVLKPGGSFQIADWGRPHDPAMSTVFYVSQAIDGFERTADHRAGRLPAMLREAGFADVQRYGRLRTAGGSLDLIAAHAPST